MTQEVAQALISAYADEVALESGITRKVLCAIPEEQGAYKPSEKCMSALDLAFHIAASEVWFLNSVANASFSDPGGKRPDSIATPSDVVAWYDAQFGPALDGVRTMSPETAAQVTDFYGVMQMPAIKYMNFLIKHSVHHRGQLSAYLRPMGGKVPSIYGGSADEPMQM
jgi:uncharacterized damage-inducible protein DinB